MATKYNTPSRLFNFNGNPPSDGLIAAWNLENVNDSFGTNHLTNNNGVTFTAGKIGNAATFNGVNQSLSIADNANISLGAGKRFTLLGWFKANTLAGGTTPGIISKWNAAGNLAEFLLRLDGTNKHLALFITSDGVSGTATLLNSGNGSVNAGVWYFFVMWCDGTKVYLELNANGSIASTPFGDVFNGTAELRIGHSVSDATFLDGQVDAIRFYKHDNRVLTATERSAIYHAGMGIQYSSSNIIASDEMNRELDQLVQLFGGFTNDITPKLRSASNIAALSINQNGGANLLDCKGSSASKIEISNVGQFISHAPTGIAPISMPTASSGMVSNLNVDLLDDLDSDAFLQVNAYIPLENANSIDGTVSVGNLTTVMPDGENIIKAFVEIDQPGGSDTAVTITLTQVGNIPVPLTSIIINGSVSYVEIDLNLFLDVSAVVEFKITAAFSAILLPADLTVGLISKNVPV